MTFFQLGRQFRMVVGAGNDQIRLAGQDLFQAHVVDRADIRHGLILRRQGRIFRFDRRPSGQVPIDSRGKIEE